jgi:hypothetical protein
MGAVIRLPSSWYPADSVDEWGRDAQLIERLTPFAAMRWSVVVEGAHHLPKRSGALLVTNSWRFALNTVYSAWALSDATGRPVRFGGRSDIAPFGPVMQRIGGLLGSPAEIGGALRAGQLVIVSTASTAYPRRAGAVDAALVGAAVAAEAPIYPVASITALFGRATRVEVGPQVRMRGRSLDHAALAGLIQRQIQRVIDGVGEA